MKILILTYLFPYPPDNGIKQREYHTVKYLAKSHEIHLVALTRQDDVVEDMGGLKEVCHSISIFWYDVASTPLVKKVSQYFSHVPGYIARSHSTKLQAEVNGLNKIHYFDIAISADLMMAHYILNLDIPLRILDAPNVVHQVAWQYYQVVDRGFRHIPKQLAKWLAFVRMKRYEQKVWRQFDELILCSPDDQARAQRLVEMNTQVIPNGVDTDHFLPLPEINERPRLLFIGTLWYAPNYDGLLYFHQKIFPMIVQAVPNVELLIVGKRPSQGLLASLESDPRVQFTGYVDDVRNVYAQAQVVIIPLRFGSGTRLKLLEAMALGRPVVSTSLGCEGLAVLDGEHLAIADSPDLFCEKTVALLQNSTLRNGYATAGRKLVEQNYAWSVILPKWDVILDRAKNRSNKK